MTASPWILVVAMFLALVPVTLPVPALTELVAAVGGGDELAHAFMAVNMLTGIGVVPVVMRRAATASRIGDWLFFALLIDAAAFVGMAFAATPFTLLAARAVDGASHLPAVTLIMVAGNRLGGRRGGSGALMGALASAIMFGVAIGSPLGGRLLGFGPKVLYLVGAATLVVAALLCRQIPPLPGANVARARYAWQRGRLVAWVPLSYAFLDRFGIGVFVSTFTVYLATVLQVSPQQRGALVALFMLPFALLCYPAGKLAERWGWYGFVVTGNMLFGIVYGSYGFLDREWLWAAMLASGILSAFVFAPNLVLVSHLVRRGYGEGIFGAFQVAGSLGFLLGPIAGGLAVAATRDANGVPAYAQIFVVIGLLQVLVSVIAAVVLRRESTRAE